MLEKKKTNYTDSIIDANKLNHNILDGMVDWVRVVDGQNIVIYANNPMQESLGKSIIGEKCYKSLGKCCECKRCITNTTMSTGCTAEKEEQIGDKIYSVKSSPVKDENGNIYAAVEVFRDVTRERNLEKELKKKNNKMSKDVAFARRLQEKILPSKGKYGNVNVDYIYRPSEMLSGDMFDVFQIDENNIGIYISDVVGHGVSASMMTMFIRQTMRSIKDEILNPAEALSELHRRFMDLNLDDDKYFTMFYGSLDKRNRTFKYVNGGHNSIPILYNENRFELLKNTGFPISYLFDSIEYEEKEIELKFKDKIILYTDGIIEAKNCKREEFGIDRLLSIIKGSKGSLVENIDKAIYEFEYEEQEDDFAVITMEIIE